ncbi:hypothetical protein Tsubulata_036457 [Turnera subulata]|uniref:Uncharacterized protein n=1 Tax=Turnera subulata TaxID=218843 RepID=A0A9Q0FGC9_9ROSI|nr:hypothetical protein Tsubulata_036457 [Turnera subulata]
MAARTGSSRKRKLPAGERELGSSACFPDGINESCRRASRSDCGGGAASVSEGERRPDGLQRQQEEAAGERGRKEERKMVAQVPKLAGSLNIFGLQYYALKLWHGMALALKVAKSYWPSLFSKLTEKRKVSDLIIDVGAVAGGATIIVVIALAGGAAAAAAPIAEEKMEEPKEESDDNIGFNLFD